MKGLKYGFALLVMVLPYLIIYLAYVKLVSLGGDSSWFVVGAVFLLGYWTWVASQILGTLRRGCGGGVSS